MLYYKVGDLLAAPQKVIAHQVNCQGKMGSGVAKAIKDNYPSVYNNYLKICKERDIKDLLGYCQEVTTNGKIIFNLFGQEYFGYDGKQYTSYAYLTLALTQLFQSLYILNNINSSENKIEEFAIPYKMGCDRGGADWKIVESILEDLSRKYKIDVYIYSISGYNFKKEK